jgi:hypothetical protein
LSHSAYSARRAQATDARLLDIKAASFHNAASQIGMITKLMVDRFKLWSVNDQDDKTGQACESRPTAPRVVCCPV